MTGKLFIQLLVNGISIGAVYALIAVGFALVFSVLKFSNFSFGGTISACAFIGFFFQKAFNQPPYWITVLVSSVAGVLIALTVDLLGFNRIRKKNSPKIYYFLSSVVFAIMIEQILTVFYGTQMYAFPSIFATTTLQIGGITFSKLDMTILAIAISLLVILIIIIDKTKLGLAIRAVAINSNTSRLMGINSSVIIVLTFAIAGFLGGITGVMLGQKYSVYASLGPSMMLKGFIASVIGGLGSLGGAIVAAILLGVVEIFATFVFGAEIVPIVLFGIMLIFLLVRPQGIAGRIAEEKA
ncbi:MAG: branched-chain amino acid ABC transporter permease [Clostridiaceae bacterium]|nr:branched-chain amino acid ABC transporter permease [Clostridiaceae bacterium]